MSRRILNNAVISVKQSLIKAHIPVISSFPSLPHLHLISSAQIGFYRESRKKEEKVTPKNDPVKEKLSIHVSLMVFLHM